MDCREAQVSGTPRDCSSWILATCYPLILWLTSSWAASYANVGTGEFEKVTKIRVAHSPPFSLDCRVIALVFHQNTRIMPVFRD